MPPALLIPLITEVGIPLATKLIALFETNTTVTSAMWATLLTEASQTAESQMLDTLKKHNIDPTSQQGKDFLALVI